MTSALSVISSISALDLDEEHRALIELMKQPNGGGEIAAIQVDHYLKNSMRHQRAQWVLCAKLVYVVRETGLWKEHPAGFVSFVEWTRQPEIDLPPSTLSDMMALALHAPTMMTLGVDIWETIIENGHSKVRQLVPEIRGAIRMSDNYVDVKPEKIPDNLEPDERYNLPLLASMIHPMVDGLPTQSYKDVINMVSKRERDVRVDFNPAVRYIEHVDGSVSVLFVRLTPDEFAKLNQNVTIKRWFNKDGVRVPHPLDFGGENFDSTINDRSIIDVTP